jgi:hypothetical protein
MSDTAVLFIVFNRPETTQKVFNAIANARPHKLYIVADAPRNRNNVDIEKCEKVKEIVNNVTWDCEVNRLYHEKNLGCRFAIQTALNWFFEQEEMGIILEDDCVPEESFFSFCTEMLGKYRNDERIISISGCNLGFELHNGFSYTFSRFMNMWGWATWRRCAKKIDYDLSEWKVDQHPLNTMYMRLRQNIFDADIHWYKQWQKNFNAVAFNNYDAWDWQWMFYQLKSKKLSIVPAVNLISNIGFDSNGTHTLDINNPAANLELHAMRFPLKHPYRKKVDRSYEEKFVKWVWCYHKRLPKLYYLKTFINNMLNGRRNG